MRLTDIVVFIVGVMVGLGLGFCLHTRAQWWQAMIKAENEDRRRRRASSGPKAYVTCDKPGGLHFWEYRQSGPGVGKYGVDHFRCRDCGQDYWTLMTPHHTLPPASAIPNTIHDYLEDRGGL